MSCGGIGELRGGVGGGGGGGATFCFGAEMSTKIRRTGEVKVALVGLPMLLLNLTEKSTDADRFWGQSPTITDRYLCCMQKRLPLEMHSQGIWVEEVPTTGTEFTLKSA